MESNTRVSEEKQKGLEQQIAKHQAKTNKIQRKILKGQLKSNKRQKGLSKQEIKSRKAHRRVTKQEIKTHRWQRRILRQDVKTRKLQRQIMKQDMELKRKSEDQRRQIEMQQARITIEAQNLEREYKRSIYALEIAERSLTLLNKLYPNANNQEKTERLQGLLSNLLSPSESTDLAQVLLGPIMNEKQRDEEQQASDDSSSEERTHSVMSEV